MPFRVLIDGKNVVSLGIERDAWQAFAGRAKAGEMSFEWLVAEPRAF